MSILVSIAAYKDTELLPTIKSLINKAEDPSQLHFAVVSQDLNKNHPDLSFVENVSYLKMDFTKARGAGYARKLAMEMYEGEDFYLQLDSHMRAEDKWDTKLKEIYHTSTGLAKTDKVILSQYPAAYEIHSGGKEYFIRNNNDLWDYPSWARVHNRDNGSWSSIRQKINDLSQPHPSHTVLAGYLFAPANFVSEIPYDERITFMGEELCIALRSYTRGWQIYAPNEMLFWHFYKRKQSPKIWNQVEDTRRSVNWTDLEMNSKRVQRSVLLGDDHGVFGIGDYDKYLEYQDMIGINFADFYQNEMHKKVNSGVRSQEIMFP